MNRRMVSDEMLAGLAGPQHVCHFRYAGDPEAMKAAAGTLDGVIDTVSAAHDQNAILQLLAPTGKYVMCGLPPDAPKLNNSLIIMKCLTIAGSLTGTRNMTQEMLDFCGKHNITSDVEVR